MINPPWVITPASSLLIQVSLLQFLTPLFYSQCCSHDSLSNMSTRLGHSFFQNLPMVFRVKAKVLTIKQFLPSMPHIFLLPPSLSSSPITLSPVHSTPTILVSLLLFGYVKATPSWDLPLYFLFPLPAMLLSATHKLTAPEVRSLLKCHLTRGIFLVTYIKRQFLLGTPYPFIQLHVFSVALVTI